MNERPNTASPVLAAAKRVDEAQDDRNSLFLEGVAQNAINHVMRLRDEGEVNENHVVAKRAIHRVLLELLANNKPAPIARTSSPDPVVVSGALAKMAAAIDALDEGVK